MFLVSPAWAGRFFDLSESGTEPNPCFLCLLHGQAGSLPLVGATWEAPTVIILGSKGVGGIQQSLF